MTRPLSEIAREYSERAMQTIVEVMEDPFAEDRDRLKAADSILDRGHGKPTQAVIAIPPERAQREAAAKLSRADLMRIIRDAPLPALRHEEPVDAEFEEVVDPLLR